MRTVSYLNYLVDKVRRKSHTAVDQEAAISDRSEFQCPGNNTSR